MNMVPAMEVPLEAFFASKNLVSRYLCIQPKFARDRNVEASVWYGTHAPYILMKGEKQENGLHDFFPH